MGGRPPLAVLATCIAVAAACSGGDSAPATTSTAPAIAGSTSTTEAGPVATTTSPAAEIVVPAGLQFASEPVTLPPGSTSFTVVDGAWYVVGTVDDSGLATCAVTATGCTDFAGNPTLSMGDPGSGFDTVRIDDIAGYRLPPGFTIPMGWRPLHPAVGEGGIVVGANTMIWDSRSRRAATHRSALWFSDDGANWQFVDVRDVLGDLDVTLGEVRAHAAGFLAVATVAPAGIASTSYGVVLESADGRTWSERGRVNARWSVDVRGSFDLAGTTITHGVEYVCDPSSGFFATGSVGAQMRLWRGDGTEWTPIDVAAVPIASDIPAVPQDAAACPGFAERSSLQWEPAVLGITADTMVIVAPDRARVAVTTDLTTWADAELPEAQPTEQLSRGARVSMALGSDDAGLHVLSLEPTRNEAGEQTRSGFQVLGWASSDGGGSWERLPLARPLRVDRAGTLQPLPGGAVANVWTDDAAASLRVLLSSAGRLDDWTACEVAPGADCSFALLDRGTDLSGRDLRGIDLSGARVSEVSFVGTDLRGAAFVRAQLREADFSDADLREAVFTDTDLSFAVTDGADLGGADLASATAAGSVLRNPTLASARTVGTVFRLEGHDLTGVDLSERDLRDVAFLGDGTSSMAGADFRGADLRDARFSRLDLTGALFDGATLTDDQSRSVFFADDVTCPDGQAPTTGALGPAACRL